MHSLNSEFIVNWLYIPNGRDLGQSYDFLNIINCLLIFCRCPSRGVFVINRHRTDKIGNILTEIFLHFLSIVLVPKRRVPTTTIDAKVAEFVRHIQPLLFCKQLHPLAFCSWVMWKNVFYGYFRECF